MVIGVTGGCGYIGSVLLTRLLDRNIQIEILDQKAPSPALISLLKGGRAKYVPIDLADPKAVKKTIGHYDYIIHLAALVGYPACNQNPDLAHRNNVLTTENIMRFKSESTAVLLTSTISNYGSQLTAVDEKTPVRPNSVYGETKKLAEDLILKSDRNIVFRFAGAFGTSPTMRFDNLIHDFVARAVSGEYLSVYESHFVRQFIHVQDMVSAILHAVDRWNDLQGEIYNVGNPKIEITKRELVQAIAKQYDFEVRFENSGCDAEKRNYPVSFKKFLATGYKPQMSLEPAIAELIEYFQRAQQQEPKRARN